MDKEERLFETPNSTTTNGQPHLLHIKQHVPGPHHTIPRSMSAEGLPAHAEDGTLIDDKIVIQPYPDLWWSRVRHVCREPFAEFMGVFIMMLFGNGVAAQ